MNFRIDIPEEFIEKIAERVAERLGEKINRQDAVFTPETLAEYLHVELSWVYKQVSTKRIPFFKAGKYIRFRKSDIDRWIQKNTEIPEKRFLKIIGGMK